MKSFRYILLSLVSLALFSCDKHELDNFNSLWEGDGSKVSVVLNYSTIPVEVQTRALTIDQEQSINDLYVIVFNSSTKKCTYRKYFTSAELDDASAQANHKNAKSLTLKDVPTGDSYIFGIANIIASQMAGTAFMAALDDVENFDDFDACVASLKENGNVDRVQSLSMSGWYHALNSTADCSAEEVVRISKPANNTTSVTLDGYIHLRRFDSKITFNIKPSTTATTNSKGETVAITGYKTINWQVHNVPNSCHVFEKDENATGITYSTSAERIVFDNETAGQSSFKFYLLENLNNATGLTSYHEREKEEKATDGTNTGNYINAPNNSTYVTFTLELQMQVTRADNSVIERRAYPTYTVHLGYCNEVNGNKANDFNCKRNTEYTYNVTIKDVDNIVVEAQSTAALPVENQPGQEGEVYDPEIYIELDAHYAAFNIELPLIDENGSFTFMVDTPFNKFDQSNITSSEQGVAIYGDDYSWIKFIEAPDQNDVSVLAAYPGTTSTALLDLYQLGSALKTGTGTKWYTVFVDENVYSSKSWTDYVNKDPRLLMLHVTPHVSPDKESEYYELGYLISQKSIQTYYNTSAPAALGIEHIDETRGRNLTWSSTYSVDLVSRYDGRSNVISALTGNNDNAVKWADFANVSAKDDLYYTFKLNKLENRDDAYASAGYYNGFEIAKSSDGFYEILATCLNRNRDLDGDGYIDGDEIRWYVPAINQYIEMYLGALSLTTPLFDANSIADLRAAAPAGTNNTGNNGVVACRNDFHFASSDRNKLFAEQGCSINYVDWSNDVGTGQPGGKRGKWAQNVRCVRNLGDATAIPQAYNNNTTTNIITMAYYDTKSLRSSYITPTLGSFIPVHDNFDYSLNAPYYQFEYAASEVSTTSYSNFAGYETTMNDHIVCSTYFQEAGADIGTWRVPNQREQVLYALTEGGYTASCSFWKYDNRVCQFSGGVSNLAGTNETGERTFRCVRDIQQTSTYDASLNSGGSVTGF